MGKKGALLSESDFEIIDEINAGIDKESSSINDIEQQNQDIKIKEDVIADKTDNKNLEEASKKIYNFPLRFKGDNYKYISLISNMYGVSMTNYINTLIEEDKKKNKEKYEKLKEIERLKKEMI